MSDLEVCDCKRQRQAASVCEAGGAAGPLTPCVSAITPPPPTNGHLYTK